MTQTSVKKLTFAEFLEQYPEGSGIFELVNGEIVRVDATRAHKNVSRFLMLAFNDEIRRLDIDYIVDKDIIIRTFTADGEERGRIPDVSVKFFSPRFCYLILVFVLDRGSHLNKSIAIIPHFSQISRSLWKPCIVSI